MKAITFVFLGLVGLVGVVAYSYLKPPSEATAPVQAIPIEQATGAPPGSAGATVFQIDPEESEARFVIDEVLRGSPKTVVGTTDQVAGQLAVDPTNPDTAQIGTIRINARTFATDSTQRDRAIQNQILQTDQHEYISFTPTELVRLSDSMRVGEALTVQIVGDLTIRGVTREATFDAIVTPQSASRLAGSAMTTIRHADWGISIPQVPAVAGVSDEVQLQLDFVATAA